MARSLNNLSIRLGEARERDAALAAIREAIKAHRRLAPAHPVRFEQRR